MYFSATLDFFTYILLLWWVWVLDKRVYDLTLIVAHWLKEEQEAKKKEEPNA